jgi:hypothetical protein
MQMNRNEAKKLWTVFTQRNRVENEPLATSIWHSKMRPTMTADLKPA